MTTELKQAPLQSTTSLVGGILEDLQHLVEQQFRLTRREIEEELKQRMAAAAVIGTGIGGMVLGAIQLCLALVHILHWVSMKVPVPDPAWLPLWACHLIVASVLGLTGYLLAQSGWSRFKAVREFHNPITEIMQEPTR